ncbi:CoA transferase [Caenimonas sedimenti]|uniref:CoA transferase n=1 Tax=Caenimonas sedimenti TaxID=2596921 RepID=A0A562ZJ83_9BURK|nr:CaiB/BaiF CoA-transferase family protein [Caenimonas sedimenti]TWO68457.1 CoA transferase [Caenimonas sedimenti]
MTATNTFPLPLSGCRVLDLSIARAGPTAVRLLADWGADVVRIDPPGRPPTLGHRRGSDEQNLHRNKRSLSVDLKTPAGKEVLMRLVKRSDVVVENFRASVKERLGLTYEALSAVNPRVILASISGFGQSGPYANRQGLDQIVQGMSGLSSVTGEPGRGPWRTGIAISDTTSGMFLGQGILLALLHRERTGRGQWVHTSLLEAMLNKLDFQGVRYTMDGAVPQQEGNSHPTLVPMGTFDAKDGKVNICGPGAAMWGKLCETLEAPHLATNPSYKDQATRLAHRRALEAEINELTRHHTVAELVERLNEAGVPCGPVYDIGQAFEDEQARHLRMTRPAPHAALGDLQLLRSPINLSACPHPEHFERAAPDAGEHTDSVLEELGYDADAVRRLRSEGAVA